VIELILTLYEAQLPRVVRMFCLLDPTCGGLRRRFPRNGGARSITTMCCLLFVLNKKRYLFILMFCFDLEILTLLLLSLRPR
jgi:hypothetical protein